MNRIVRNHRTEKPTKPYKGDSTIEAAIKPSSDRKRFEPLAWLVLAIFIFALLYHVSYLALLWSPAYGWTDMKSRLVADYGAWSFLVFQPVGPAIIEEIKRERGLPEQIVIYGWISPTPTGILTMPPTASYESTAPPQATSDDVPSSPTALQPTFNLTPMPTSTISNPEPTVTMQPTGTPRPTRTRKPHNTPKPHKTPKPFEG